jgi:hypothetical protein
MHRQFEVEAGAARPGAAVADITGEALLAAIEIDGGDALAGLQQGNGNMQGGGGFTRTALLVAQHNYMGRARLPLTSLHQHFFDPRDIFKLRATAVKQNAQRHSRFIDRVTLMMNRTRKSAASVIGRTIGRQFIGTHSDSDHRFGDDPLGDDAPVLVRSAHPATDERQPLARPSQIEP